MSMILFFASTAFAAKVYWLTPPGDAATAGIARAVPGATSAPLASLGDLGPLSAGDRAALETLRRELQECRPLTEVFDGELQIMARLSKATTDVRVLPTVNDRTLLYEALVFEGLAVRRYFQDRLGVEPLAASYRVGEGAGARVRPWVEAASLLSAPTPSAAQLPESGDRVAYDDVQAYVRVMPSVSIVLGELARDAEVYVDGQRVEGGTTARVFVTPGRHYAHAQVGSTILVQAVLDLASGSTYTVNAPYGPAEAAALEALVSTKHAGWTVPGGALSLIRASGEPTYVATLDGSEPLLYRVDTGTAEAVRIPREEATNDGGLFVRGAAGVGWASTGDWFLQNVDAGAPYERSTVNAVTPAVAINLGYRRGLFAGGVGGEILGTPGEWHSLPSGAGRIAAWPMGYVFAGLPWVQALVGVEAPWYVAFGLQGNAKLVGPVGLYGRATYGQGLTFARDDGPEFAALPALSAWGGVEVQLGGGK